MVSRAVASSPATLLIAPGAPEKYGSRSITGITAMR